MAVTSRPWPVSGPSIFHAVEKRRWSLNRIFLQKLIYIPKSLPGVWRPYHVAPGDNVWPFIRWPRLFSQIRTNPAFSLSIFFALYFLYTRRGHSDNGLNTYPCFSPQKTTRVYGPRFANISHNDRFFFIPAKPVLNALQLISPQIHVPDLAYNVLLMQWNM